MEENNQNEVLQEEVTMQGNETVNTEKQNDNISNNKSGKKLNICALISFIFSLIGIVIAGLPCGIVAAITGIIGLVGFKSETENNRWMAIFGLCAGIIEIVIMVIYMMELSNL